MGSDLAKAVAAPFVETVRACTSLSSESDCEMSKCCTCHTKTAARDLDDAASDEEICTEDKPT